MVSPLHVEIVVIAQYVHNAVGGGTTVEYVTQHMQCVYGEPLDEVAQGDDKVVGTACGDNGADDDINIRLLVGNHRTLMQ